MSLPMNRASRAHRLLIAIALTGVWTGVLGPSRAGGAPADDRAAQLKNAADQLDHVARAIEATSKTIATDRFDPAAVVATAAGLAPGLPGAVAPTPCVAWSLAALSAAFLIWASCASAAAALADSLRS